MLLRTFPWRYTIESMIAKGVSRDDLLAHGEIGLVNNRGNRDQTGVQALPQVLHPHRSTSTTRTIMGSSVRCGFGPARTFSKDIDDSGLQVKDFSFLVPYRLSPIGTARHRCNPPWPETLGYGCTRPAPPP
jgi:hypothetical protein